VTYATIDDLRESLADKAPKLPPEYVAKMMHAVPTATTVDRAAFVLERCKGKRVLEFGASGPMHDAIRKVAAMHVGVDREDGPGVIGFDLDDITCVDLPAASPVDGWDVIVCGEVLEHLSNPGHFLARVRRQYVAPVIITVPNAFSQAGRSHIERGTECVNRDHVAWYSWKTLSVLLGRVGYSTTAWHWYGGPPLVAEGLIVVVE
jgi:hypothetical protein